MSSMWSLYYEENICFTLGSRKRAKELKKEKSYKLHQARDEAAKEFGFSNFKHYKNSSEVDIKHYKSNLEVLFKNLALEKKLYKKMKLAISFMEDYQAPFRDLLDILKQFQRSKKAIQGICEKLQLMKDEIQSFMLDDFRTEEGQYEISFRAEHFIAKEVSVSNLTYELSDGILFVDGSYVLKAEFEFELAEDVENDGRFNDLEFDGSFGIEIDRNKKITFVHSDMSADSLNSEFVPSTGFTEEGIEDYYARFPDERGKFDDILKLDNADYDDIRRCLSNNEPLAGKALELALGLVDVHGDDEQSKFIRSIGVKIKAGLPLAEYEHHILVDVLMLHAQLGA